MTKEQLAELAINQTLDKPTSLNQAFNRLGFVQADPIRSPARAEELILRLRVKDYKVGDLDQHYAKLGVEEDFLYAHGFMTRAVWQLLHPRQNTPLQGLHLDVYNFVKKVGIVNSNELANQFGRIKVTNWWGGSSQATRMALEELHYFGYVRIAGRQKGIRVYQYFEPGISLLSVEERKVELIMQIVSLLGPVQRTTLNQALHRIRKLFGSTITLIDQLLEQNRLIKIEVEGLEYISLPFDEPTADEVGEVRFLAPFDPVVWDRKRFEHLWGWPYRFEAYTPAAKRVRGYYAMPMLWQHRAIGWVNISAKQGLQVESGYIGGPPATKQFKTQFDAEVERIRVFLG